MSQRIVLIGPGAIGGITAAFLAKAGDDITLVCKHSSIVELASGKGLHITGVQGTLDVPVRAVKTIEDLEGTFDFCLIATKAYDMPDCARKMLPHLADDALVVSMQNGICTDALSEVVGPARTVGCVIGFGATMKAPGELEMTSTGTFRIGMPDKSRPARLEELRRIMDTVVPAVISDDIYADLYSKLIVNACITALGAVCGLTLGEMMQRRDARRIFLGVISEGVKVAEAEGLTIPPYAGKLDYHRLMKGTGLLACMRRHLTIRVMGIKYSRLKSSSLQSLERGRPTEVPYLNGYIVRKGAEAGVICPINERLTEMISQIEQGKRRITPDNLADLQLTAALDDRVG